MTKKIIHPTEYCEDLYNLKIINCGDNVEVYLYTDSIIKTNRSGNKRGKKHTRVLSAEEKLENRKKSLNVTKNKICRIVKSNSDLIYFVTLTFKEEVAIEESKKYLNNLFTKMRRDNEGLKYIWVVERGDKNNRIHYHLLTNFNFPSDFYYANTKEVKCEKHKQVENDFQKKYWKYGFTDVRKLDTEGIRNVGGYISYYITKSLMCLHLADTHVFGCSRSCKRPVIDTYVTSDDVEDILKIGNYYDLVYQNSYRMFKNGKVNYFSFRMKENNSNNITN